MGRGVQFGLYHSNVDWGLTMTGKSMPPPTPKTAFIEVGGRNGSLDLTEALCGYTQYDDRDMKFTFLLAGYTPAAWNETYHVIATYLHGQRLPIVDDDDTDNYYLGRCAITAFDHDGVICTMTIAVTAEPYKISFDSTQSIKYLQTTNLVDVSNFRFINGSGRNYINSKGVLLHNAYRSISHPIPMAPNTTLHAYNNIAIDSLVTTFKLNCVYVVEYDENMNFLGRSADAFSAWITYTTSANCAFVVVGFGCTVVVDSPHSLPFLGFTATYANYPTADSTVTDTYTLPLGKEVIPKFYVNGSITITHEDINYTIKNGEYTIPAIVFDTGDNVLTFRGKGAVKVAYNEVNL